ncbi:hypothetical protein [Halorubrum ezzemoulense]|uniref:hypothetical protein n=1 Tax=Halorubrum ezzemoulense TaxID=337243 RepID=UPI00232FC999|nr:hypothetical protein [Halorubrum ezzemoulense]MDB2247393.1 hypothetical protein [Halorubrum ezzemoulense]
MTRIQQVLFELETGYLGHPYYVTGNALYQALAQRVDEQTRRALSVSNGMFLPKAYGTAPSWYSQDSLGKVGLSLPPVETYDDLFLLRDAAQRWLKSSWPRDAHNAHPVQTHGGRLAFDSVTWFGRPPEMKSSKRSVRWFVQCYLSTTGSHSKSVLPVADETLDGLQVGGARNYGFGQLSVVDSQLVDLEALDYDRIAGADEHALELVSPFVVASDYPGADDQSVPWWWDVSGPDSASRAESDRDSELDRSSGSELRRRPEQLVDDGEVYELATVDHGQLVGYDGSDPIGTAKNGVSRVGTHSRFGFGELRVRPASDDRVPDRVEQIHGVEKTDVSGGEA